MVLFAWLLVVFGYSGVVCWVCLFGFGYWFGLLLVNSVVVDQALFVLKSVV